MPAPDATVESGVTDPDADTLELPPGVVRWGQAMLALRICAVAGGAVGGVRLAAKHGPVRTAWLDTLASVFGPDKQRVVPANITDDRLTGAIDLAATLAAGKRVDDPGLLSALPADGCAVLQGYDRMQPGTLGLITQAWDRARFLLVAVDEAERGDPDIEARLRLRPGPVDDRLGLWLDLDGVAMADCAIDHEPSESGSLDIWDVGEDVIAIRKRFAGIVADERMTGEAVRLALMLGVHSLRAAMATVTAACAVAAIDGRDELTADDIAAVLPLTLLPRATQIPAPEDTADEDQTEDEPPPPEPPEDADAPDADRPDDQTAPLDDQVIEAAEAILPPDLLAALAAAAAMPSRGASGASGAVRKAGRKGRRFGARQGPPGGEKKLNLIETLRAAAPWQTLRAKALADRPGGAPAGIRVHVRKQDFRVYRQKERAESVAVFVVDASGSSAVQRFAEAKGAIELLLGESYARRDHVALVAVRGHHAEVLLPPTRSLTRAKRVLSALPGGGGTPLASGIDAGLEVALGAFHRGQSPMIVVLTDGQANIGRDGQPGRKQAAADALDAGRAVQVSGLPSVVIDTSNRPQVRAADIAASMGARYMPLPRANAEELARTVASVAGETRQEREA
jgi:magnesium chelatase subunit D